MSNFPSSCLDSNITEFADNWQIGTIWRQFSSQTITGHEQLWILASRSCTDTVYPNRNKYKYNNEKLFTILKQV